MTDFYVAVKSTVDKIMVDLASELKIDFVELDDTVNVEEKLSSPAPLVVYRMLGMDEAPADPLWRLIFNAGGKTTTDAANYKLADIIGEIKKVINKGEQFEVRDYSGVVQPVTNLGYLYITDTQVDPQMFEGASGIRLLTISAMAVRY